jgi:16S rRNA G966 N2-methylase RsmD
MQTLGFLKNIDWQNHDGVGFTMINDFIRNQFYNNIFKDRVAGKQCIDIGFGTGLLSILALANNAQSIIAYESDINRYQLGKLVIDRLGLDNKIQLIHDRYDNTILLKHTGVDVVFAETVDGNLWSEGLWNNFPRLSGIKFLPNEYFLNLYAVEVPNRFAQGTQYPKPKNAGFNPGVDIDLNFIKLINEIGFPLHTVNIDDPLKSGIIHVSQQFETPWSWMPYLRLATTLGRIVAGYKLNVDTQSNIIIENNNTNTLDINFTATKQTLMIDTSEWKNKTVLIVPRVGLSQDGYQLNLDSANNWGPAVDPILLVNPDNDIVVTHDMYTGKIEYKFE